MGDDLIKRADAIKALYKYSFVSKDVIEKEINAIDAVEVVRCRDCKEFEAIGYCLFWGDDMDADGFCSYGERKDDVSL